jgi:radical SAM superfamily enzyme YgiQ (UPF0313 family)
MKIVLILCPSWGIETPHLGIALLASSLRRRGFQVEIFDFNIRIQNKYKEKGLWKSEEDVHWEDAASVSQFINENDALLDSFSNEVCAADTRVVGFSIYNTTQRLSLELAKRIKKKDKNKLIIFGGQQCFPWATAKGLIKDEAVDAVVIGEGDEILPELMSKVERLRRIDFCPGLIYKEKGNVIDCGARPPISNLDNLAFADFSDFSLDSYGNPQQLPILSSRGCPYQCVFCSTKLFWEKYRYMSGERIFKEVEYQINKHRGVYFFTFNDHTVNGNMQSIWRFCDLVLEAKSKRNESNSKWEKLSWRGAAVIRDEMDKEFIGKMKAAGCIELEYGVESASMGVRRLMKKPPYDIRIIERVIRDTHEAGIGARVNFIFGFPGETEADFEETLNFLKRNKEFLVQVHPSETFCCIDPGTALFNHPEEFGVANQYHSLFWESIDGKNTYPERLKRHQTFCELANALGIPLSPGGYKIILHKEYFLEEYYKYRRSRAVENKN